MRSHASSVGASGFSSSTCRPARERLDRERLVQVVRHRDDRGVEAAIGERGGRATRTTRAPVRSAIRCAWRGVGIDRGGDA